MRLKEKLLIAASLAALMPAMATSAEHQTRELMRINASEDSSRPIYVNRKAPGNASYETMLVGFVYYADSWNRHTTLQL